MMWSTTYQLVKDFFHQQYYPKNMICVFWLFEKFWTQTSKDSNCTLWSSMSALSSGGSPEKCHPTVLRRCTLPSTATLRAVNVYYTKKLRWKQENSRPCEYLIKIQICVSWKSYSWSTWKMSCGQNLGVSSFFWSNWKFLMSKNRVPCEFPESRKSTTCLGGVVCLLFFYP